ncbi:NADH-quinone oxidoreductase subunit J family protein [Sulfuracidifex metallicus]|uniref:NADH-quinone oxidoreductase subunit J n=1 Tax=Sulfuracidifex metallicus DSM 6482 = JCM 9184 TaxID=523847 RepID=A0A6A9QKY4_SULME|nr:NADH-quinone oxidoreductase subunit J [Sulfuracidifex metallicus]MUN28358.1 NADH-quinone oxidoreductase subunit J [Sulfuracidifex metallicus DSM 6482 = JCM 9184]WOE51120.1 NADH-quinone oxidoreductase subunit J [Sulfuracidifex metallicus DSM 6482 = JCM 9184]
MFLTSELLQLIIFGIFSVVSLIAAVYIINSKNVFYAAVSLAFLGIAIAVLIADLAPASYSIYSAFHILLYVGATVVFLSISMVIFKDLYVKQERVTPSGIAVAVTAVALFLAVIFGLSSSSGTNVPPVSLQELATDLLTSFWFPAIVLVVALLTTLIEAITLARRD